MTNELRTEIAAMFAGASQSLRNRKAEIGSQAFVIELGQLLTEGDKTVALGLVAPVVSASCSSWPTVDSVLATRVSTDLIPTLITEASQALADDNASQAFALLIVLLAAEKNARGI